MVLEKLNSYVQKKLTFSYHIQKINSKWIKDLIVSPKTINSKKNIYAVGSLTSVLVIQFSKCLLSEWKQKQK